MGTEIEIRNCTIRNHSKALTDMDLSGEEDIRIKASDVKVENHSTVLDGIKTGKDSPDNAALHNNQEKTSGLRPKSQKTLGPLTAGVLANVISDIFSRTFLK